MATDQSGEREDEGCGGKVLDFFFLNSIRATPSACEADMRAGAALQVYLSNIVHIGPLLRQCRRRYPFFSTI